METLHQIMEVGSGAPARVSIPVHTLGSSILTHRVLRLVDPHCLQWYAEFAYRPTQLEILSGTGYLNFENCEDQVVHI